MRGLVIVVFAGCSSSIAGPAPAIDGFVIDPNGAVANAEVHVTGLQHASCACKPKPDDSHYDNATPECSCPESFAAWRKRLAACVWPVPAMATLRSDKRGRVSLPTDALGSMVETTSPKGVSWLALPPKADRVGIELAKAVTRKLRVDTSADLQAALLFDDGHCVPFTRDRGNVWVTAGPVPQVSDVWPVLLVETKGFAPYVHAWYESAPELTIALHRAQPITGKCAGDRVTLDNPYQHIVARVAQGQFSIADPVDTTYSEVKCMAKRDVVEEWVYSPADGLLGSGGGVGSFGLDGDCHDVLVVDHGGSPVANAEVTALHGNGSYGGTIQMTDARGRACVEMVYAGADLDVHPPLSVGGWCAGMKQVRVTDAMVKTKKPIRVAIDITPLPRSPWRGHLVTPEHLPIVGAYVSVSDVQPIGTQCSERSDASVMSGIDGTFELPLVPHGTIKLDIRHDWYTQKDLDIKIPSRETEIVLDRGVTWSGRVLDPDGKAIDTCDIFLTLPNDRLLTAKCSPRGFTFTTLVPGEAKVSVRVHKHALGTFRALDTTIQIKGNKPLHDDIKWPAGESIEGRAVDAKGAPIAGARLTALPKGVAGASDRFVPDEVMLECDADGHFVSRHLKPGTWQIIGDRRVGHQSTTELTTGTKDVQLVLSR